METSSFDSDCAHAQIQAVNLSVAAVQSCMGNSDADAEHPLLQVKFVTYWQNIIPTCYQQRSTAKTCHAQRDLQPIEHDCALRINAPVTGSQSQQS